MELIAPDGYDYLFKVIVLGDKSVGKTSLLRRFCFKTFDRSYIGTIGVDFMVCDVKLLFKNKEVKVKLQLWDTSGEEKYKALTSVYYRNAECAILVFDLNYKPSFEHIPFWLENVYDQVGDAHKVLVGNKCDLDCSVTYNDIKQLSYYNNLQFVEASAKDSTNVEEVFERVARELVERREQLLSLGSLSNTGPSSIFFHQDPPEPKPDYAECIKPVQTEKPVKRGGSAAIKIEADGYYQINEESGEEIRLKKAEITLNDCLACSGCITSAETVLIAQQSQEELYRVLQDNSVENAEPKVVVVSISPQSIASLAAKFSLQMTECFMKLNTFFKQLGCHYVFDTNLARNFSLLEMQKEFQERFKSESKTLPMLTSACPGWICYAEKTHGSFILPYISKTKSPQQIMGSLVKTIFSQKLDKKQDEIYNVTIMPCYDKKLEASREDFYNDIYETRDVDLVITTMEIENMLNEKNIDLPSLEGTFLDRELSQLDASSGMVNHRGSSSGGYLEHVFIDSAKNLCNFDVKDIEYKVLRNKDFQEVVLNVNGEEKLRFAFAFGFRNIQNVVQKIKRKKCTYHFIEIMACPVGCINGGGQVRQETKDGARELLQKAETLYKELPIILPETNDVFSNLVKDIELLKSEDKENIYFTEYHEIKKNVNALNIKW